MNNNSYMFGRIAKLRFETEKTETKEASIFQLTNKDIDFDCSIDLDNTNNSNKATINIYNLPQTEKILLVKNTKVTIEAGYEDEGAHGIVFYGIIEKFKDSRDNDGIRTEIQCTIANDEMKENKIQLSFGKGAKASTIISSIISKTRLQKGEIKLGKDIAYERGKTFNNHIKNIFSRLATDTQSRFYISNSIVFFYPVGEAKKDEIQCIIGMVNDVSETDEGFTIKTFFDHRVEEGTFYNIDYKDESLRQEIKGKFEVIKVRHAINTRNGSHDTEIEIKTKIKEEEKKVKVKVNGVKKEKSKSKKGSK